MTSEPVSATPYNPLLTYQFRVQLLDPPADATPEQLASSRTTLTGGAGGAGGPGTGGAARTGTRTGTRTGAATDRYVAGVRRVSGLTLTVAATETWEGGNSLHRYANPHRAVWEPILLEQGLALDDTLQEWANAGIEFLRSGRVDDSKPVKRNLLLDVWDPAEGGTTPARRALRYLVFNAWVSKYQAVPRLDAMSDEVGLLSVELTHHGWRLEAPPASTGTGGGTGLRHPLNTLA